MSTMTADLQSIQHELIRLQRAPLSIIKLSEPLISPPSSSTTTTTTTTTKRTSIDSASHVPEDQPSPSSLASDLTHYRELFKKLHFSYLEQVSKEKFLRAIVGDPPLIVEPSENTALEAQLNAVKADLQAQKDDIAALVADLETQGRELARRHEAITLQTTQLQELPAEVEGLRARIEELERQQREQSEEEGDDPRLRMPLGQTMEALEERRGEMEELDREIAELRKGMPDRKRQTERLEAELKPLEARRNSAVAAAKDAERRRQMREDGFSDELELKGRWYKGANEVMRDMLGVGARS